MKENIFIYRAKKKPFMAGIDVRQPNSPNKKDHPGLFHTSYHAGLMTSRTFAAVENVMKLFVIDRNLKNGAIPLCLEHDGINVMGSKHLDCYLMNQELKEMSEKLIGMPIQIEAKT